VAQAKVSRTRRGLDIVPTFDRLRTWVDVEVPGADSKKVAAVRCALSAGIKVGLRLARAREYALAHNAMLEWVWALPAEHGEAPPFPAEAALVASHPPHGPVRLLDVFAGVVGVLREAGFTFRECVDLVDDGWGGPSAERIRRARRHAKRAGADPWAFLHEALSNVKGDCVACRSAEMAVASGGVAEEDTWASDDVADDERAHAGGGGRAGASRSGGDGPLVGTHREASGESAGSQVADPTQRRGSALVRDDGQTVATECKTTASRRPERARSQTRRRGPAKAGALKR
jgi:hypothetical protein